MSSNEGAFKDILEGVEDIVAEEPDEALALSMVCKLLKSQVPHYDWVGFYIADPSESLLRLGPYVGAPTDHVLIPFGKGICGQAADGKRTFIVQDVTKEDNYLSCGSSVRSEIVLPVMDGAVVIGELDIDSHTVSPFTDHDSTMLEHICMLCAPLVRSLRDGSRRRGVQV